MHNVLENLKDFKKLDLDKEYKLALKDPNFKLIVDKLKLSDNICFPLQFPFSPYDYHLQRKIRTQQED